MEFLYVLYYLFPSLTKFMSVFLLFLIPFSLPKAAEELPKGFSDEELLRKDEILSMRRSTDPPPMPIRNVAEYERMQGVIIRYPLGISTDLISEISEDVKIYCLVSSSLQTNAFNLMENNGVNMNNVEFINGPTDSYWTRDYGPWWVVDGNYNMSVVDFTYNRPRPNDNNAPLKISQFLDTPYFSTDLIHAGGNYMTDGLGISASSDLVYIENDMTEEEVLEIMEDYYGINTYHVVSDPNNTYIDHIDCWGKYLSPTKVLIREVPSNHPQYDQIEQTASYFEQTNNKWGEPWELLRIYTPQNQPYTNSLILNNKVFVPITGSNWDEQALSTYQSAMPGYEILGFNGSWESTDALHCRIKGIPDLEMLQLFHNPINDSTYPGVLGYDVLIEVAPLSGEGLINDSLLLFWKNSSMENWNLEPLINADIQSSGMYKQGWIPPQTSVSEIQYYIKAADSSGRVEQHPIYGYHQFLALPTDICQQWTLGDLDNSQSINVIDLLLLTEQVSSEAPFGLCPPTTADINQDGFINVVDIVYLTNLILYP